MPVSIDSIFLVLYVAGRQEGASEHGLAYDVVITLCESLVHQGYHVYFDNFYTSIALLEALYDRGLLACGTAQKNRRRFPEELKEDWKGAKRGTC
jgi:hypothetical protein